MAKKRVDVEIGSKNKVAAGLKSANASIKRFASNVGAMLKRLAVGALALGTAVTAFGVKSVKAFMVQESAEKALAAAMRAHGDAVDELLPKHLALAKAIQDETGIADEATIAKMATLRTLGVMNSEMEAAIKLTLALGKAGMREKAAMRAAADAMNGNTTALTSYIPELRGATTQSEKLAIVNSMMTRGYGALKDELDSNAGRLMEVRGRIGDFMEGVGQAILKNASFGDILQKVSARIKELTESGKIDEWATKIVTAIKSLAGWFAKVVEVAKQIIALRMEIMWIAIAVALGRAGIQAAHFVTGLYNIAAASVVAAGGMAKVAAAALSLKGLGMAAVFTASAIAIQQFAKVLWESHKATQALIKSQKDLKTIEGVSKEKYGTRHASTLRTIKEKMATGTDEEKETIKRLFPKAYAALTGATGTPGEPAPGITTPTPSVMGPGAISAATSMLSTGDMFSMMQAGTGAKRESELSELQEINRGIQDLIGVSGGVE